MEPKFQSSFIPKGPAAGPNTVGAPFAQPKPSLYGFIAGLIFTLTLLLAAGVFGYERYLLSSIGTMGDNLQSARATLQPDTINELVSADKRITSTRELVTRHTIISPLFDFLEQSTMPSVRFTGFSYTSTDKGIEVTMKGQARSYADVAMQSDAFNSSKIFINPLFSDLSLDEKGNVTFSFQATLDPSVVSFSKHLAPLAASSTPAVAPALNTTASTTATTTPPKTGTASSTATTSTSTKH